MLLISNYDNLNSNELLEVYNSQGNFESSSIYTEHDDSHWDRDEYDDYDFNGRSTTGGGYADQHSDSWHHDD